MIAVTLPDGKTLSFDNPITVGEVATRIGTGLGKAALGGKVDNQCVDLSYCIEKDCHISIITDKSPEGLDIIRHSCAHLLAQAVKALFPTAQVTIGPVIEDGFYYDFAFDRSFTPEDLEQIEKKMEELAKADLAVVRSEMPRDEAVAFFRAQGEEYKAKIIEDIPANETLSLYTQAEFTDLCRGPHVPRTGRLKAFKLTKLAGAYWRGDNNNEMLQRIYGTAWANKKELEDYLYRIEEAKKRDHRELGKRLQLFHMQDEAAGMAFWHPDGWTIYKVIMDYIANKLSGRGYCEIRTPQIVSRALWEKSGHWAKFLHEMFTTGDTEGGDFAIKPMNCPCHIQVFNQGLKSYRDLPLRLAEFGSCHRKEPSGTLHGLMRVRNFTQDDAHIFCTEDQIAGEVNDFIDLLFDVYKDFGFTDIIVGFSTRPEQRVGSEAIWDKAEQALEDTLNSKGLDWELKAGDGAFYGPKIDFTLKDCLGRAWQCGTLQLDFSMPERLGAQYVADDGARKVPVMLHRAILGSLERFIGVLIEQYAGIFPPWLAPWQAAVLTITDAHHPYAQQVVESLKKMGFRVKEDLRNEKIGFKIREHILNRVPYLIVIGEREVENQTLAVRTRQGNDLGSLTIDGFADVLQKAVQERGAYK
ncbi:MAG: threonine--tRNA ligase [Gammaproteobacteria bacterium]